MRYYNRAFNRTHWPQDETMTFCGRHHEQPTEVVNGIQFTDQIPTVRLAWCKDAVSCKICRKKLPTRYERLALDLT